MPEILLKYAYTNAQSICIRDPEIPPDAFWFQT